jgi:hypothetical protein
MARLDVSSHRNGWPQKKQNRLSALTAIPHEGHTFFAGADGAGAAIRAPGAGEAVERTGETGEAWDGGS